MKKYIVFILMFGFILNYQHMNGQKMTQVQTDALINSDEFSFHAERANPTNYDVINIANSLPNAPAMRMFQLQGQGYGFSIKKNELEVVLPYFGRVFNPTYGNSNNNSYRFTSKDFKIEKTQKKKGKWVYRIQPKDVNNVSDIYIEVFKDGGALVSVKSNDRQPISYDGYISKTEIETEKEKL
ncbi:DUF4251 domain-containing protein [Chryseobacterium caseinilyticum]|uniref:DUF4251 domain-containing protein n=1 Tax=Chryseobacterium caseinilyticum TaxID=2771428 RepID=A0ABR8ZDC6_9FLAO|nr:DUF4251 domain-containing protein [Chryseobacterium caseinilyticum]MBD8083266.1 DUF4251 domain-containing protein [Chryseobacterium caseinilyticum]